MKTLILALTLLGVTSRPVNAAVVEGTLILAMDSTKYCVGASWNLKLSNAAPNASIRLSGTANGIPWEIPRWADTDASGNFSASGTYAVDTASRYTLGADIGGSTSNILPVEVVNCGWKDTGSLTIARAFPTATLLASGKVLVTGAWMYPAGGSDSAELYDPVTETWSSTGSLTTVRAAYTATLLPNGKVLVAGGYAGSPLRPTTLRSAELYDPETGTWSRTGDLSSVRVGHTATLLADGRVLVSAGDGAGPFDGLAPSELYDPLTGTWRTTGILSYGGHLDQRATLLPNGKVLLFGGIDNRESYPTFGGAALYDPATETWTATGKPKDPGNNKATLLHNGKVLIDGGSGPAEIYDPETGSWSSASFPHTPRLAYTTTLLPNGKVLFAGSLSAGSTGTWTYDPDTGIWSDVVLRNTARLNHTATLLLNGKVLAAGGYTNSAELYETGLEIPLATLNSTRYCVGDPWNLTVTHPARTASVTLLGLSNGKSWKIPQWGSIDADGSFKADGFFANGTEGTHTLRVEVRGVWSRDFSFVVSICRP